MSASAIAMDGFASASVDLSPEKHSSEKLRIANSFGRAATTYDASASLQQKVAAAIRRHLPVLDCDQEPVILDMGCGTGRETAALHDHYPAALITGLDLSEGMLSYARSQYPQKNKCWIRGDIEQMPFHSHDFDLVFSSLAIQWCESLECVLSEVSRVLKPGGWFLFSTLAEGSLHELRQAWLDIDSKTHVNNYASFESQSSLMTKFGFEVISLYKKTETLYYTDVQTLLKEMKGLGANTVIGRENCGLFGRTMLKKLSKSYSVFATEKGLPASYQIIYGVLRKA